LIFGRRLCHETVLGIHTSGRHHNGFKPYLLNLSNSVARVSPRSRGIQCPSFASVEPSFEVEGAGKIGHRLIPAVRVQQKARGRTTGQPNNRPSLRNGLDGLYALSSGTALFAPVVLRIICRNTWHQHRDARTTRFRRRIGLFVRMTRSRCKPTRPPHPRLNVRDDREAPLLRAGTGENVNLICPTTQARCVRQTGMTGNFCMDRMQGLPVVQLPTLGINGASEQIF